MFSIIGLLQIYIYIYIAHKNDTNQKYKIQILLTALNKIAIVRIEAHLFAMLKKMFLTTIHHWIRNCTSHCTSYNMVGDTLAKVPEVRFRSSWNISEGNAYTRCLMHPQNKNSEGFVRLDEPKAILRNHNTKWFFAGISLEWPVGYLILYVEGSSYIRTKHSGGHSTANSLENRILCPSEVLSKGITLTCLCNIPG